MKPLRRKKSLHVTEDMNTGQERVLGMAQEDDVLSDLGSIDSLRLQKEYPLDCGCFSPVKGRCFECGALSCELHHGICQSCQKPICMEHSHFYELEGQGQIRLCRHCHDKVTRKQTRKKIGSFLLSLVVQGGRDDG